jgi:hypothetical protein
MLYGRFNALMQNAFALVADKSIRAHATVVVVLLHLLSPL